MTRQADLMPLLCTLEVFEGEPSTARRFERHGKGGDSYQVIRCEKSHSFLCIQRYRIQISLHRKYSISSEPYEVMM